jgi:hypothetical protein
MTWPGWPERRVLGLLVLSVLLVAALALLFPDLVPLAVLLLPVMLAGWRLTSRSVVVLGAVVLAVVVGAVVVAPLGRVWVSSGVVLLGVGLAYRYARLREQWGLSATQGLGILLELRDGLRRQGELVSPPGWTVGRALRSANDDGMRGDFTLALERDGLLQVVLVDVSGHGADVAAHAGQLAGAFGGLLGAVPPHRLLPACNDYLLRQQWRSTFATAAHLTLDVASGQAEVRCAGHPPPLVRRVTGQWEPAPAAGPLLGLAAEPRFAPSPVHLRAGDTLLLLSDGLLDPDTHVPLDPLLQHVDDWASSRRLDVPDALLTDVHAPVQDDQSLVLVRRERVREDEAHGT